MEEVSFTFSKSPLPIISNFNFKVVGAERVALVGANGSGKTTLVKLIQGIFLPSSGTIFKGTEYISYLDQHANQLDPEASLIDNFLRLNPTISEQEARHSLAQFIFRNTSALKKVKDISGGEKLRALLACILMAENPPQLLILDEPTNHLDFESINRIESIINQYQGALLVISHDQAFLDRINIHRFIHTPFREQST